MTRPRAARLYVLALPWLLALSFGTALASPPVRVLFVGNSHTATNGLPQVVEALAARQGVRLEVEMIAEPGYSLGDHLAGRDLRAALQEDWDWIVLQQGPSSLPESREDLIASTRSVAALLQGPPTRIALLSVWPHRRHRETSHAAEESYRQAASAIGGCVLPAATAWRHALAADAPPRLYQRDQLHASEVGTVLAALTMLPGLIGEDAAGLASPDDAPPAGMDEELHTLHHAAARAHREEPERCRGMAEPTQQAATPTR